MPTIHRDNRGQIDAEQSVEYRVLARSIGQGFLGHLGSTVALTCCSDRRETRHKKVDPVGDSRVASCGLSLICSNQRTHGPSPFLPQRLPLPPTKKIRLNLILVHDVWQPQFAVGNSAGPSQISRAWMRGGHLGHGCQRPIAVGCAPLLQRRGEPAAHGDLATFR